MGKKIVLCGGCVNTRYDITRLIRIGTMTEKRPCDECHKKRYCAVYELKGKEEYDGD